jgi:hypothetical protein
MKRAGDQPRAVECPKVAGDGDRATNPEDTRSKLVDGATGDGLARSALALA